MANKRYILPLIPLRGLVVFPGMVLHFDVGRKTSMAAVEDAMANGAPVMLSYQYDPLVEEPEKNDIAKIGVVAEVKQVLRLPGNNMRVLVEGLCRASITKYYEKEPFITVSAVEKQEKECEDKLREQVLMRRVQHLAGQYLSAFAHREKEADSYAAIDDAAQLADIAAANFPLKASDKQLILEELDVGARLEKLVVMMDNENQVLEIEQGVMSKLRNNLDKNQRDYVLREQLKVIREELGDFESGAQEADKYRNRMNERTLPDEVSEKLNEELDRMSAMSTHSQEYGVIQNYVETVLAMPWDKSTDERCDIKAAERILNRDHYGLEKVKERVLEYLAVRVLTKKGTSPILCLVGPPGTGKTSIARSVARALNKKYVRISLGGVHDEAEIRGHRKTYVGSMPGRIAEAMRQAGVANPLMLLDEIDKVSGDYKGDVASALLEVLDGEQNVKFRDHYVEIPLDLSGVLFIATANTTQTIPGPLLDRMEVIEVSSYTENEKFHIARNYLVTKQLERNGLDKGKLTISDKALEKIIHNYTREAGVRNLERRIGEICRKAAREFLERDKTSVRVTEANLEKYLGKEKITFEDANQEDQVGIVRGLAWTSVGGDTLQIEVNVMPGDGKLQMTGQMGDVMKESAQIALTYVRSVSEKYEIPRDYFETHDMHLHIPEGAVPKDGPSAGITMATAMLSAVTGTKVHARVAMTGEITLRGRVLPIGGLKEKTLAARMAHMEKVLVPAGNQPDMAEISKEITKGLSIVYVKTMEDVIREAFV